MNKDDEEPIRYPPYDQSKIDWRAFVGDDDAKKIVVYYRHEVQIYAKLLGISLIDTKRQWCQLMYFFATVHLLGRVGMLLPPGHVPLQPPPKLVSIWRVFCEQSPEHLVDYCRTFWNGLDVGWRSEYSAEHRLSPDRLQLIHQTANLADLPVDDVLWF